MKTIKYLLLVPLALMFASCDEHELGYADSDEVTSNDAMYQITYVRPVANSTSTRLDSLYMNGKKVFGVGGSGYLAPNGTFPSAARYFTVKAGTNHLVAYNRDNVVYEQDVELVAGRQRLFIYDFAKAPIIHTEPRDYKPLHKDGARGDVETYDTDSLMRLRLFNFFFEDANTPYPNKVQYQWSNNSDKFYIIGDWHNLGEPIGFGEATDYEEIIIHKTGTGGSGYNSAGNQTIRYRCVDASGNTIAGTTDYWTGYIGRWVTHTLRGCRTGSPAAGYSQLNTNVNI